jgi:hypothetical protein
VGRTKWIVGLVLWTVATGPQSAAGESADPSTLRVLLHDDAGVPAETVERARQEVSGVFRRSKIPFAWISADACAGSCFIIKIVSQPVGAKSRDPRVVGIAPGTRELRGKLAFVFYDRIRVFSAELGLDVSQMLGHVMAHELGHLLLPYGAHSLTGIMRPAWDRLQVNGATGGTLRFTSDQPELIRTRLQNSASPIAHAPLGE